MQNAAVKAQHRLALIKSVSSSTRGLATSHAMSAPKIRKIGPLPTEEAKWTELRKIEVGSC